MRYPKTWAEKYREKFPGAPTPDWLQLPSEDIVSLSWHYKRAIERGRPLTPRDFGLDKDDWHGDLDPETTVI